MEKYILQKQMKSMKLKEMNLKKIIFGCFNNKEGGGMLWKHTGHTIVVKLEKKM